jgi:hypothetical protein
MAQRSSLRASDADREEIGERLRRATAEGRLHAHELEERMAAALRARTYGELDAMVADLPRDRIARGDRGGRGDVTRWVRPAMVLAVAIPVALVAVALVIAAVVFVLSGVFAVWMLWMAIGWWFFGHRHHRRHRGGPPAGFAPPRRAAPRPGSLL